LQALRSQGVDVLSVRETIPGATDEAVLDMAVKSSRWLVTFDRDYGELVFSRQCPSPVSILFLRQEPMPPTKPAEWVMELLSKPEIAAGHLVVIGEHAIRRRLLPKVKA
jgi:predicted nuclease of predicted toxin-antitoxin system